jgi:hypothetical protein
MSENKRSFWASVPGLVTGIAGLLTGIVGLVTVLIQLNVIGGKDDDRTVAAVSTTVAAGAGGSTTVPAAGGTNTTISGRLTAVPSTVKLQPTERDKVLTVRNDSTATLTVQKPEYTGADKNSFTTDAGCTNVALRPGGSCTVKVTLNASGPLRSYKASLVLDAKEVAQVTEVPIEATTLL